MLVFCSALVIMARGSARAEPGPDPQFRAFVAGLWPEAQRRGISRAIFDRAFDGMVPDEGVIAKTKRQPEFSKPIWEYLSSAVSATRIETGTAKARDFNDVLARIERQYGVDRYADDLLAAGGASAQSMWSIDQREASQQDRIDAGRRDGSLTRSEAARLQQGEQRINRYEARARADGVVTPAERQRLDGMLDRESRQIHNERTDGQRAGGQYAGGNDRGTGWDRGNHYGARDNRNAWSHGNQDGDRGNHNGWNQANAGHNGWTGGPRGEGGQNQGAWNHNGQPATTPGTTTPTHAGLNGSGQGSGAGTGQGNGQGSGQSNGWTHGTTQAAGTPHTTSYTQGSNSARVIPASAPTAMAAAPSRTSSGTTRTSRH